MNIKQNYIFLNLDIKKTPNFRGFLKINFLNIISLRAFVEREKPIDWGFVSGSVTYLLYA